MLENMFGSVVQNGLTFGNFMLCTLVSLALGIAVAWVYMRRSIYSKSFAVTLALMPAMVQVVIMLVNGNLGAGVAVMGAFSLVRFRSVPGTAREIGMIFFAMAIGLACGMGYLAFAVLFMLMIGIAFLGLSASSFGDPKEEEKLLKITIPENLDYDHLFDDIFRQFTSKTELIQVRTVNMGSLFELHYHVRLKSAAASKEFLDQIRCRNGNLNISCGRIVSAKEEL